MSNKATELKETVSSVSEETKEIFTLVGVEQLVQQSITTTYETVREIKPSRVVCKRPINHHQKTLKSYPLKEVTPDELAEYRKAKVPSFVLKIDGKLYHCNIPEDTSFQSYTLLGPHKCATSSKECNRLSAASDEQGGCAKVRAYSVGIERYPWIEVGYETFGTKFDSFVVVECSHYEKCPPRKHYTPAEITQKRLSLAQFFWDDVETIEEWRRKKDQVFSRAR